MPHSLPHSNLTTTQPHIPLQHAYSLPSIPQIHPPTYQLFNYLKQNLHFQINASNHNPLIFHQHRQTILISPPNFHPQPIPFPLHHFKLPL
ncbi:aromatic amino acid lyase, partial [Staphylococcus warneri]|uniref:aromatic amino acid lyase n=1 Tax=Staphylococcus warneri TaxID=1292 RepID=UPI0037045379